MVNLSFVSDIIKRLSAIEWAILIGAVLFLIMLFLIISKIIRSRKNKKNQVFKQSSEQDESLDSQELPPQEKIKPSKPKEFLDDNLLQLDIIIDEGLDLILQDDYENARKKYEKAYEIFHTLKEQDKKKIHKKIFNNEDRNCNEKKNIIAPRKKFLI